jgi:hypothetical protein
LREVDGFCFDETQRNGSTFATDLGVIVADEMLGVRILLGGCSGVFKKEDIERTFRAYKPERVSSRNRGISLSL